MQQWERVRARSKSARQIAVAGTSVTSKHTAAAAAAEPTDLLSPAVSLASAALSAPSAREVPPMSPKLRMRDNVTLQCNCTSGGDGEVGARSCALLHAVEYPFPSASPQRLPSIPFTRNAQPRPAPRPCPSWSHSLEQLAADVLHDARIQSAAQHVDIAVVQTLHVQQQGAAG